MSSSVRRVLRASLVAIAVPVMAAAQDRSAPAQPVVSAGENGVSVQSPTGDFQLRVGVLAQADGRFAPGDEDGRVTDTFAIRRLRPALRGRIARRVEFLVRQIAGSFVVTGEAGVNWFLTPNVRYVLNLERTVFDDNASGARPAEQALVFRSQVNF